MAAVEDLALGPFRAVKLTDRGDHVTLVPERGAIVTSFVSGGRERLYLDQGTLLDPKANVRGGIPVLFPSPGKLAGDAFRVGSASGSMKQHGFARASAFRELSRGTDGAAWVELALEDSDATRAQFPFAFRLRLRFELAAGTLTIRATVENPGTAPLPFALGYHPYFAVPNGDKSKTRIPTAATRAWDNVKKAEIALTALDLSAGEVDLHLVDHGGTRASLIAPEAAIELSGDFARWVIWTLPGKDFVCLEPWSAPGDALNTGVGRSELAPGESRVLSVAIEALGAVT